MTQAFVLDDVEAEAVDPFFGPFFDDLLCDAHAAVQASMRD